MIGTKDVDTLYKRVLKNEDIREAIAKMQEVRYKRYRRAYLKNPEYYIEKAKRYYNEKKRKNARD